MMEIKDAFNLELDFYKENNLFDVYYSELEWNCILHVLYYSAFRYLTCGYYRNEMKFLYDYCQSNFPNFKQNKYICEKVKSKYLMETILNKFYFLFYLKTGFRIKCVNIIKSILNNNK